MWIKWFGGHSYINILLVYIVATIFNLLYQIVFVAPWLCTNRAGWLLRHQPFPLHPCNTAINVPKDNSSNSNRLIYLILQPRGGVLRKGYRQWQWCLVVLIELFLCEMTQFIPPPPRGRLVQHIKILAETISPSGPYKSVDPKHTHISSVHGPPLPFSVRNTEVCQIASHGPSCTVARHTVYPVRHISIVTDRLVQGQPYSGSWLYSGYAPHGNGPAAAVLTTYTDSFVGARHEQCGGENWRTSYSREGLQAPSHVAWVSWWTSLHVGKPKSSVFPAENICPLVYLCCLLDKTRWND